MFQTLNPHVRQGGQEGFSHDQIVAKSGGSIVSGDAMASLRPVRTPPSPPTILSVSAAVSGAVVFFNASTAAGSSPITTYKVTSSPGGFTATGTKSPLTIYGLTNGVPYTFSVVATSSDGSSASSVVSAAVTPVDRPGPPTAVSVVTGNGQATVSFGPPVTNGGAPITRYQVTAAISGDYGVIVPGSESPSPILVTGLTNGATYTFYVYARNKVGLSLPATISAVIPATVPGVPTGLGVNIANGIVTVNFTAPTYTGGALITSYTVTSNPGNITATGTTSPIVVPGLTIGTSYTFSVVATNSKGSSAPSAASPAVTYNTVPGPPTEVSATHGNRSATVYFTAPINTGGLPITGYTVTSSPGGFTATGATSPIIVSGLNNGTSYSFIVVARNSLGSSPMAYTATVIPSTVPGRPNGGYVAPGVGKATVTFYPPSTDGGAPITGYTVTSSPGGFTATGTAAGTAYPYIITGLTNGTPYTFSIVATNINGASISVKTYEVTPANVPSAPTNVSVTVEDWETSVSFTAPADNGGSPIIAYSVSATPVGATTVTTTVTGTSSPITVTGLTSGTSYIFSVVAVNSIGESSPAASGIITPVFVDKISASLTSSRLTEYQAATSNEWIKITAAEYTALQANVSGTTKAGIIDDVILSTTAVSGQTNDITNNASLLVANGITTVTPAIPANNYLYAFAISWVTAVPTEGMRVYTNINKTGYRGYNQVGSVLPATTSSGMSYYVRKGVVTTNGDTDGTLACFSGTRIDYPDANGRLPGTNGYDGTTAPAGSGGYIGTRLLAGTGITPIPTIKYQPGIGTNAPAANVEISQGMSGVGAVVLQGLATPKRQWD